MTIAKKTNDPIIQRILNGIKDPDLLDKLADGISSSDLQSLLLAIYRRKARKITPNHVFEQFEKNRFVRSSNVTPQNQMTFDRLAFSILPNGYASIELSPVCPLGTVSAIAPVDQNNVLTTIRNTEVCADPTNVMALECALQRRRLLSKNPKSTQSIKLASSQRVLRAQTFDEPGSYAHFRIFTLCTAGRDTGGFLFQAESLTEHIDFYLRLLQECHTENRQIEKIRLSLLVINKKLTEAIRTQILPKINSRFPKVDIWIENSNRPDQDYYRDIRFQIFATNQQAEEFFLIDGGFTDWTQRLLSNHKERLLISGLGSERLLTCF